MKNLISTSLILSFILFFNIAVTSPNKNIEVIVKTPYLKNRTVALKLVDEFYRMSGVVHAESAFSTNTFMIIYKNGSLSQEAIENIFSKWGCRDIEFRYELVK